MAVNIILNLFNFTLYELLTQVQILMENEKSLVSSHIYLIILFRKITLA